MAHPHPSPDARSPCWPRWPARWRPRRPRTRRSLREKAGSADNPVVYVAADDGSSAAPGVRPRARPVSPDGHWVAWIGPTTGLDQRCCSSPSAARRSSCCARSRSPICASRPTRRGRGGAQRPPAAGLHHRGGHGRRRSPSASSTAARSRPTRSRSPSAGPAQAVARGAERPLRGRVRRRPRRAASRAKDALNPLWGAQGIVFDRQRSRDQRRAGLQPVSVQPDGGGVRRITTLKIPPLDSGLVPLDLSADGGRLLAGSPARTRSSASPSTRRPGETRRAVARTSSTGSSAATSPPTARPSSATPAAPTRATSTTW